MSSHAARLDGTHATARGFTLVELVVAISLVGICATTIMTLISTLSEHSAETLVQQQAAAIANAYLQEATSRSLSVLPGSGTRASLDDVADYNFTDVGARDQLGNAIAGLSGYRVQVTSQQVAVGTVPASQSYRVVVTVTDPRNRSTSVTAFKMAP